MKENKPNKRNEVIVLIDKLIQKRNILDNTITELENINEQVNNKFTEPTLTKAAKSIYKSINKQFKQIDKQ